MQILVLKQGGRKALHQGSTPLFASRLYSLCKNNKIEWHGFRRANLKGIERWLSEICIKLGDDLIDEMLDDEKNYYSRSL